MEVLTAQNPEQEVYVTVLLFMGIVMNSNFLGYVFGRFKNTMNVMTVLVLVIGLNQRIYGYNFENIGKMAVNSFSFLFALPVFMYCNVGLMNISKKQEQEVSTMMSETSLLKEV